MLNSFVNCMEKVELGGNIRVFAYFTSGGRFFALHGNLNQPLTTVTEVTHLSKSVNRGDAHGTTRCTCTDMSSISCNATVGQMERGQILSSLLPKKGSMLHSSRTTRATGCFTAIFSNTRLVG